MKNYSVCVVAFLSLFFLAVSSSDAQFSKELRPFDFTDKYYQSNGVVAEMLIGRKNGADGESVFDFSYDRRFRNVRVTATLPAYDQNGAVVFWNHYADVSKAGFTEDALGPRAVELAYDSPLYVFPSATVKDTARQAAQIHPGDSYFEKNELGISAVFVVEYTELINTKAGQAALDLLAKRNGLSLDGTPIIRTAKELATLHKEGLVRMEQLALDLPNATPFAVAPILRSPELGAIAPDAFLKFVKDEKGNPLAAEQHVVDKFDCLKAARVCF